MVDLTVDVRAAQKEKKTAGKKVDSLDKLMVVSRVDLMADQMVAWLVPHMADLTAALKVD